MQHHQTAVSAVTCEIRSRLILWDSHWPCLSFYLLKHDNFNQSVLLRPGFGQFNNSVCNSAVVPVVTLRLKRAVMCFHCNGAVAGAIASTRTGDRLRFLLT